VVSSQYREGKRGRVGVRPGEKPGRRHDVRRSCGRGTPWPTPARGRQRRAVHGRHGTREEVGSGACRPRSVVICWAAYCRPERTVTFFIYSNNFKLI
jgi:hypothetical protein